MNYTTFINALRREFLIGLNNPAFDQATAKVIAGNDRQTNQNPNANA